MTSTKTRLSTSWIATGVVVGLLGLYGERLRSGFETAPELNRPTRTERPRPAPE